MNDMKLVVLDINQFRRWLAHASPGSRTCYYIGSLIDERGPDDATLDAHVYDTLKPAQRTAREIGDLALDVERRGVVKLFQYRIGEGRYAYLAERTGR